MILDPVAFEPEARPVEIKRVKHARVTLVTTTPGEDGAPVESRTLLEANGLAIVTHYRVYVLAPGAQRGEGIMRYVAEHDESPGDIRRERWLSVSPVPVRVAEDKVVEILKGDGCACGGWSLTTYQLPGGGPVRSGM